MATILGGSNALGCERRPFEGGLASGVEFVFFIVCGKLGGRRRRGNCLLKANAAGVNLFPSSCLQKAGH